MRAAAGLAAAESPVPAVVVSAEAAELPLAAGSVDAVVFSEVLCSVPDQAAALAEARRVLRPGGELRVFEHVAALSTAGRGGPRGGGPPVLSRALGGGGTAPRTPPARAGPRL